MNTPSTQRERGKLVTLIGPTTSGKTTLEKYLVQAFRAIHILSDTTRVPRNDEIQGLHYNFVSIELFQKQIQEDYFAEWEEVHGKYYGTPKKVIETALANSPLAVNAIDYKGARKLIRLYPENIIPIFLRASPETLVERLLKREGITSEEIDRRMRTAKIELAEAHTFSDIINTEGTVDHTFKCAKDILEKYGINTVPSE